METWMEEKRNIERYILSVPAELRIPDEEKTVRSVTGMTRDVSSKGAFIMIDDTFKIGQKVELGIYLSINRLQEFFELDKNVLIEVSGEVVRCQSDGVGIRFDKRYTILPNHSF